MVKFKFIVLSVLIIFPVTALESPFAEAQNEVNVWINKGPFGGNIIALALAPSNQNIIYAASSNNGGVFKSADGGDNWSVTLLMDKFVNVVAVDFSDPDNVYAGTIGGVFKSTDGGDNWNAIIQDLPAVLSVEVQTIP